MYSISVIIPVYNTERYIEKSVHSLFMQTLDSIQYIFIDDNSSDNSIGLLEQIIKEYPQRQHDVILLKNSKNHGSAYSRNIGLKEALGEYVIYCDSDDWISLDAYEKAYKLAKQKKADIVIFGFENVYHSSKKKELPIRCKSKDEYFRSSISGIMHNSVCNKLVLRSLYIDNNIHYEDGVNMLEDSYVTPRLLYYANKIVYLDEYLYFYNQQNTSSYTHNISRKRAENILDVMKLLEKFLYSNSIHDKYYKEISYFKNHAKLILLLRSCFSDRIRYCSLYPEAKQYIWKHPKMNGGYKFLLWISLNRYKSIVASTIPLINSFVKICKFFK